MIVEIMTIVMISMMVLNDYNLEKNPSDWTSTEFLSIILEFTGTSPPYWEVLFQWHL